MQYYAVIDTNVIVSAMLKWDSIPGSILELALDGPITPVLNHEILDEYQQVLLRPKFHLTERIVGDLLDNIIARAVFVDAHKLMLELPDPKDVVFYEVTMGQRKTEDTYLVTGNLKHFPSECFVVTPRQMLDIIVNPPSDRSRQSMPFW